MVFYLTDSINILNIFKKEFGFKESIKEKKVYNKCDDIMHYVKNPEKDFSLSIINNDKISKDDIFVFMTENDSDKIHQINYIENKSEKKRIYLNLYYNFKLPVIMARYEKDFIDYIINSFGYKNVFGFTNIHKDIDIIKNIIDVLKSVEYENYNNFSIDDKTISIIANNLKLTKTLQSELKKIIFMNKDKKNTILELKKVKALNKKEGIEILNAFKEKSSKKWF